MKLKRSSLLETTFHVKILNFYYVTRTLHFASSTRVGHSTLGHADTPTITLGQKHVKFSIYAESDTRTRIHVRYF